jgi:hypothetical protein
MSSYKFLSLELSVTLCDNMCKSSAIKKHAYLLIEFLTKHEHRELTRRKPACVVVR